MASEQDVTTSSCICFEKLTEAPAAVLMKGYSNGISITPCAHMFHHYCIMKWLKSDPTNDHTTCPYCRTEIKPEDLKPVPYVKTPCEKHVFEIWTPKLEVSTRRRTTHVSQSTGKQARENIRQRSIDIRQLIRNLNNTNQELGEAQGSLQQKTSELMQANLQLTATMGKFGEARQKLLQKVDKINQLNLQLQDINTELKRNVDKLNEFDREMSEIMNKRRRME